MTPAEAREIVAEHVVREHLLHPTVFEHLWEDYPEIGEHDWDDIVNLIAARRPVVSKDRYHAAYTLLTERADQ